jgi:hypothetical protein
MRPSPSPFAFAQRLSASERRTVAIGATVSAVALGLAFGIVPFARRWSAREDAIAAAREQVGRLEFVAAHEADVREAVGEGERRLATGARLLTGRTPALAASALQTLIQGYADQSNVTVTRLDVAGAPADSIAGSLPAIPATLSAIGDIYGVTELLSAIERGARLVEITELTVVSNSALKGGLLQISLALRAPYRSES